VGSTGTGVVVSSAGCDVSPGGGVAATVGRSVDGSVVPAIVIFSDWFTVTFSRPGADTGPVNSAVCSAYTAGKIKQDIRTRKKTRCQTLRIVFMSMIYLSNIKIIWFLTRIKVLVF
jgi:hypothetical protein